MMELCEVEYLDYEEIRQRADQFLDEYWAGGGLPVDIEHIIDVELGIHVAPVSNLKAEYDIDGCLSADRTTIWVDKNAHLVPALLPRYRFTLGHEIAHWYLHRELYDAVNFASVGAWQDFHQNLSWEQKSRYEFQANCFAGLVLVQREPLADSIDDAYVTARNGGLDLNLESPEHVGYVASFIRIRFGV